MNYYQRIQKAIDYIEDNLEKEITVQRCAKEAYMSVSGFYRMFLSVVGYQVREYIRMRRLTAACDDLLQERGNVLEVAMRYEYTSADSFTRAFKKQFGILPSRVKSISPRQGINEFARVNIMEKYFETGNKELEEKYPDIKVIKELEQMKVACFTYFGRDPEAHAYEKIKRWAQEQGISFQDNAYRLFGYNHPDPSNVDDAEELYGYEFCITISDEQYAKLHDVPADFVSGTYTEVKRRTLGGGKYAVMSVGRDASGDVGNNIIAAWKRFTAWLEDSKYLWGGNQYLEEHLGFSDTDDHIGGLELYISIQDTPRENHVKQEEFIPPYRVAVFRAEGEDPELISGQCIGQALAFAEKNHLDASRSRIFQYNKGFDRSFPFFHVVMITLPENFDESHCTESESVKQNTYSTIDLTTDRSAQMGINVSFDSFPGGKYMTVYTSHEQSWNVWMQMEKWCRETKAGYAQHQWVEEWYLDNWKLSCEKVKVCYPII